MKDNKAATRRDFIHLSSASLLASLIAAPGIETFAAPRAATPTQGTVLGRVTRSSVRVYQQPDFESPELAKIRRDKVIILEEEATASAGPTSNRRWYRIKQGYVHSAYIQRIENFQLTREINEIPKSGILGKVTVPFTQSWRINRYGHWKMLYRLYYDSLHWITDIIESPEGVLMAQISDDWLRVRYYASLKHFQPVQPSEYEPLSPEVPEQEKRIIVSLNEQTISALETSKLAYRCQISTGLRYMETPTGKFYINRKYPSRHMGNGGLTSAINAYELPGVPWVSFFGDAGVAFHGTYWHDNFGTPMSRGCVNLRYEDARWIFRWTTPVFPWNNHDKPIRKVEAQTGVSVEVVT